MLNPKTPPKPEQLPSPKLPHMLKIFKTKRGNGGHGNNWTLAQNNQINDTHDTKIGNWSNT
jgi:hypothetical protein